MKKFINRFNENIAGVISCFDRMPFKGYLPLGWSGAMESLLARQGMLVKDFKQFVMKHSQAIKAHAEAVAGRHERPFLHLNGPTRKEALVRKLAEQDGITEGLVCGPRTVEPSQSFRMIPGEGRPRLVNATRKCRCFHYDFIDREFGLIRVRIQSWFPLAKGVANMPRYREVALAANRRYPDALSTVKQPGDSRRRMRRLAEPVATKTRSHRASNPARQDDVELMAAVLRGEHTIRGFTNADIRGHLRRASGEAQRSRLESQRIGRRLKLRHAHGPLARIPRSRRWRVTVDGWATMTTIPVHHHDLYPHTDAAQAA